MLALVVSLNHGMHSLDYSCNSCGVPHPPLVFRKSLVLPSSQFLRRVAIFLRRFLGLLPLFKQSRVITYLKNIPTRTRVSKQTSGAHQTGERLLSGWPQSNSPTTILPSTCTSLARAANTGRESGSSPLDVHNIRCAMYHTVTGCE